MHSKKTFRIATSTPASVSAIGALTAVLGTSAMADSGRFDNPAFPRVLTDNFVILDGGQAFIRLENDQALVLSAEQFTVDAAGNLIVLDTAVLGEFVSADDQTSVATPDGAAMSDAAILGEQVAYQLDASFPVELDAASLRMQAPYWSPLTGAEGAGGSGSAVSAGAAAGAAFAPVAVMAGSVVIVATGLAAPDATTDSTPPIETPDDSTPPSDPRGVQITGFGSVFHPSIDQINHMDVSAAGDVNNDGLADFIIGAKTNKEESATDWYNGKSYVVFGNNNTDGSTFSSALNVRELTGQDGFAIYGIKNSHSGHSVSAAGDVNGDGVDDLIIGAPFGDSSGNDQAGKAFVVYGKDSTDNQNFSSLLNLADFSAADGFSITGANAGDNAGVKVASAGDVNNDGNDDILITSTVAYGGNGATYVVYGRGGDAGTFPLNFDLSTLLGSDSSHGFVILGPASSGSGHSAASSGYSVSSTPDINGDGIDDLIIGAPHADSTVGQAFVVFGKDSQAGENFSQVFDLSDLNSGTANGTAGFVIKGAQGLTEYAGSSVSYAGDINNDGVGDLIVGAPKTKENFADVDTQYFGKTFVVFGKATPSGDTSSRTEVNLSEIATGNGADGFIINSEPDSTDYTGQYLSYAGDVNGDGIHDLIIGSRKGKSYVVFGENTNDSSGVMSFANSLNLQDLGNPGGPTGFKINGSADTKAIVSGAGDIDGDGYHDLVVGAPKYGSGQDFLDGDAYIIFGQASFNAEVNLSDLGAPA